MHISPYSTPHFTCTTLTRIIGQSNIGAPNQISAPRLHTSYILINTIYMFLNFYHYYFLHNLLKLFAREDLCLT